MNLLDRLFARHIRAQLERLEEACRNQPPPPTPDRLSFFLYGFSGFRNTGADARMEEMVRQIRCIFGGDRVTIDSLLSHNRPTGIFKQSGMELSEGYFAGSTRRVPTGRTDRFILEMARQHHMTVAIEGAMFKSNLSNLVTIALTALLGAADRGGQTALAYGVEAGKMDQDMREFAAWACRRSRIIVRNSPSKDILDGLGLPATLGTDNAWTFHPRDPAWGQAALKKAGWDGQMPVVALCPVNPFWLPSSFSPQVWAENLLTGRYAYAQRGGFLFHRVGADVEQRHAAYLDAIAAAVRRVGGREKVFPVIVGTSLIDSRSCRMLAERLEGAPCFLAEDLDMFEVVSILRCASALLSSRFHAVVLSMPAGVPSAALSIDERLNNLLEERGHGDLVVPADAPDLADQTEAALVRLLRDHDAIAAATRRHVLREVKRLAEMGRVMEGLLMERFPGFPFGDPNRSWEHYVPLTDPVLRALVEEDAAVV